MEDYLKKLEELSKDYHVLSEGISSIVDKLREKLSTLPSHFIHIKSYDIETNLEKGSVILTFYWNRLDDDVAGYLYVTQKLLTPDGLQACADEVLEDAARELAEERERDRLALEQRKQAAELELERIRKLMEDE